MPPSHRSDKDVDVFVGSGASGAVPMKAGAATPFVRVDDIRMVTACENYTKVTVIGQPAVMVRRTMQQWIRLLPDEQFARIHRGLLVNLDALGRVERLTREVTRLHFVGDIPQPIDVKRRHWPALRSKLEEWRKRRMPMPLLPAEKSIAVLPFVSLSQARENGVFCDGLTEELTNVLAKIPGLRVAARTSAFYFKHKEAPLAEIARALGVAYLIEGSVRRERDNLRITVQLIDAAGGFHLWSDSFDRETGRTFGVQDDIARLVAGHLQLKLAAGSGSSPAVNPEAHRLALEARHFWTLRTSEALARGEEAARQALELEPRFAVAHAVLADICVVRAMYRLADGAADASDDLRCAEAEARAALTLNPALAEPHAALGFACFHAGRFAEMGTHFERALASNPNYPTAHQFHAWSLAGQGELDRALTIYARAIALDPLSFINLDRYGAMLALAGRHAEALAANERAAALRTDVFVGNLSQRAPILWALGRREQAIEVARHVREIGRGAAFRRTSDADAIFVLKQAGLEAEAEAYGHETLAGLGSENYLRSFILAAMGRPVQAIGAARQVPAIMLPFLYWSTIWAEARDCVEFADLIATLGRTEEYRTSRLTGRM